MTESEININLFLKIYQLKWFINCFWFLASLCSIYMWEFAWIDRVTLGMHFQRTLCNARNAGLLPFGNFCWPMFSVNKFWVPCVINYRVPMSKRKPTSSQPGINWYFCKSRRTESLVGKGEKTAGDGDQQTQRFPCARRVIQQHVLMVYLFIYLFILFILSAMNGVDLI